MSYEGREVYICENGHIHQFHASYMDFVDEEEKEKIKCSFCGTPLSEVGGVDDTNGESVSRFRLKKLTPEKRKDWIEGSGKDIVIHSEYIPATYEVIRGAEDEYFNFDTGEKYDW